MSRSLSAIVIVTAVPLAASADPDIDFYEKKIRPALALHCYQCHSAGGKQRGGLMLDGRSAILTGGDSGPAVVPGDAGVSRLIKAVRYTDAKLKMPPTGKLPAEVIADLEKWVAMGAPAPDGGGPKPNRQSIDIEVGRQFWSFQPPQDHPAPKVSDPAWANGPADWFILAKLDANGLSPVGDADPTTLMRRMSFGLTGLPPEPADVDCFAEDDSPDATVKAAERMLASPAFGERWGRHWLDIARYAESTGGGRSLMLPDAWRYRDYVIRSFNGDKPIDRFITEQLAGDLLPEVGSLADRRDRLTATAYLALGPTNYERQDKDILEMDVIDEQLDTIGRSLLGMTIGCARCHDHKFDPIPTADYYAMAGVMKSTRTMIHDNVSKWVEKPLPLPAEQEKRIAAHQGAVKEVQKRIKALEARVVKAGGRRGAVAVKDIPGIVLDDTEAERVGVWQDSTYAPEFVGKGYVHDINEAKGDKSLTFRPELPEGEYEVRLAYTSGGNRATKVPVTVGHAEGQATVFVNMRKPPPVGGHFVSLGKFRFKPDREAFVLVSNEGTDGHVIVDAVQFADAAAAKQPIRPEQPAEKSADAAELTKLEKELKKLQADGVERPTTMCVTEHDKVGDIKVCVRGNFHVQGEVVPRRFLQVATVGDMPEIPEDESGRLQLARWVASDDNPLTARVFANRVWHHLFGTGIVRTTDNFGTTGELPSHPELLDHLALEFQRGGWSAKELARSLVLSRTFGLSSEGTAASDPENRLLSRAHRRRLDAESLRDAMLHSMGRLDRTMGGSTVRPGTGSEYGYRFDDFRRSVYTPVFRNQLHELFEVFDFPDPNLPAGRRNVSTVSTQALFLMNNPTVIDWAELAAERSLKESGTDADRVERAYRRALGRGPSAPERELAVRFLADSGDKAEAWVRLHQALFGCIDFRYVR